MVLLTSLNLLSGTQGRMFEKGAIHNQEKVVGSTIRANWKTYRPSLFLYFKLTGFAFLMVTTINPEENQAVQLPALI